LLSLPEVAARLGVSTNTIRRMRSRGEIRVIRIGNAKGLLRVAESELQRLMTEGTPAA
jgi:excisionase family DNA binding protein